jgi:hypothetical protein
LAAHKYRFSATRRQARNHLLQSLNSYISVFVYYSPISCKRLFPEDLRIQIN